MDVSGLNNPTIQVVSTKVRQAIDPRPTGYGNRVCDYIVKLMTSRFFKDDADESFDKEVRDMRPIVSHYVPTARMNEYIKNKAGDSKPDTIRTLMTITIERMATDAFERHGLMDVLALYHCEMNPNNLVLAALEDIPTKDLWKVVLKDMPSRGGSEEFYLSTRNGYEFTLRPVYEADRGDILVGPKYDIINGYGLKRTAVIDMVSFENGGQEWIVFGNDDRFDTIIAGTHYAMYRHVDTPTSKTACPHYRLYNMYGSVCVNTHVYYVPVILARLLRGVKRGHNLLEMLPHPEDMLYLTHHRTSLNRTVIALLCAAFSGELYHGVSGVEGLREMVDYYKEYRLSDVFSNGLYKAWAHTDAFHGKGHQWDKLYESMFNR